MVRWRPVWMTNHPPSVLWHCWLGHQTCKNRRPYNLLCWCSRKTMLNQSINHSDSERVVPIIAPFNFTLPLGGTAAAAPPPFRPGNPALCGSRPLVAPYYCRLGDLLCFVFMSAYCMFDLSAYCLFLQYFDAVGWVFWPVKTVSHITYTVLAGT